MLFRKKKIVPVLLSSPLEIVSIGKIFDSALIFDSAAKDTIEENLSWAKKTYNTSRQSGILLGEVYEYEFDKKHYCVVRNAVPINLKNIFNKKIFQTEKKRLMQEVKEINADKNYYVLGSYQTITPDSNSGMFISNSVTDSSPDRTTSSLLSSIALDPYIFSKNDAKYLIIDVDHDKLVINNPEVKFNFFKKITNR